MRNFLKSQAVDGKFHCSGGPFDLSEADGPGVGELYSLYLAALPPPPHNAAGKVAVNAASQGMLTAVDAAAFLGVTLKAFYGRVQRWRCADCAIRVKACVLLYRQEHLSGMAQRGACPVCGEAKKRVRR